MSAPKRTLLLLALASGVSASVSGQNTNIIAIGVNTSTASEAKTKADEWGVTVEEWHEYEEVMTVQRGVWSPGLDPLTVLGVVAKTSAERKRFAELYVQTEYERVERKLAFEREVAAAWKRLYPNKKPVERSRVAITDKVDRFSLVVTADCPAACNSELERLFKRLEKNPSLQAIDIYVRDSNLNDRALRRFVQRAAIPIEFIQNKIVTINHGNIFEETLTLPAVFARRGGVWIEI